MKKVLSIILIAVAVMMVFVSCDDPKHEHSYSQKFDETNHWMECSCGDKKDVEAHTFGEWKSSTEAGKVERKCTDCEYIEIKTGTLVSTAVDLKNAIENESVKTIVLSDAISLETAISINRSLTVDMNGKTIAVGGALAAKRTGENYNAFNLKSSTSAYTVTFKNGTIKNKETDQDWINHIFSVDNNAVLNLDDVDIDVKAYTCVYLVMSANPSTLNVTNGSKLFNCYGYGIGTNATSAANTHANITIKDSSVNVEGTGSAGETGLLVNVPCTVSIESSTISGDRHGVIFRATDTSSDVKVSNSTIKSVSSKGYSFTTWGNGNNVPQAALVIGNSSSTDDSYPRGTKVVLEEVTLELGTAINGNHLWVEQASATNTTEVSGTVKVGESVTLSHNDNVNGATVSNLKNNDSLIWDTSK